MLVIDDASLKIVATLLHTEALRQHGVTLVLAIDREREAIADAPVVYFVRSTQANAAAIVKDLEGGLYKEVRPVPNILSVYGGEAACTRRAACIGRRGGRAAPAPPACAKARSARCAAWVRPQDGRAIFAPRHGWPPFLALHASRLGLQHTVQQAQPVSGRGAHAGARELCVVGAAGGA